MVQAQRSTEEHVRWLYNGQGATALLDEMPLMSHSMESLSLVTNLLRPSSDWAAGDMVTEPLFLEEHSFPSLD